jgi:hypothetical protein
MKIILAIIIASIAAADKAPTSKPADANAAYPADWPQTWKYAAAAMAEPNFKEVGPFTATSVGTVGRGLGRVVEIMDANQARAEFILVDKLGKVHPSGTKARLHGINMGALKVGATVSPSIVFVVMGAEAYEAPNGQKTGEVSLWALDLPTFLKAYKAWKQAKK